MTRIALIGDYDPGVKAHQGIPLALTLASAGGKTLRWDWLHTSTLADDPAAQLSAFDAVWCVPASPYANTRGALAAIRFARLTGRPFLGTCGGFQHALLECAEGVWGIEAPAHAELDPAASDPVIAPLACSLVEQSGEIRFVKGSRLAGIYGVDAATEGYHCRYGLNPRFADRLTAGPLVVSGRDEEGAVRAVELDGHPFFLATLFQPERSGLVNRRHPLIAAFVAASHDRCAASNGPLPAGVS